MRSWPSRSTRAARPRSERLAGLRAAGLTPEQALAQLNRLVDQQAFMLAANDIFFASALLFLVLIPLVWLSRPQRSAAGSGADAAAGAH